MQRVSHTQDRNSTMTISRFLGTRRQRPAERLGSLRSQAGVHICLKTNSPTLHFRRWLDPTAVCATHHYWKHRNFRRRYKKTKSLSTFFTVLKYKLRLTLLHDCSHGEGAITAGINKASQVMLSTISRSVLYHFALSLDCTNFCPTLNSQNVTQASRKLPNGQWA